MSSEYAFFMRSRMQPRFLGAHRRNDGPTSPLASFGVRSAQTFYSNQYSDRPSPLCGVPHGEIAGRMIRFRIAKNSCSGSRATLRRLWGENLGGHFDQPHPSNIGMTFAQQIPIATVVEIVATLFTRQSFHGNVEQRGHRRIGSPDRIAGVKWAI
jgi:hypothetical protein